MDARVEATQERLPDGPLLYPGPLCGGEAGSTGRAAGVDRDVDSFSPGQATAWMPELRQRRSSCPMPVRKARPRLTDLPPMDGRQAPSGVAFLFGYLSLWPRKEKVTRLPKADESSSLYAQASPQAYQLKCDACLRERFGGSGEPFGQRAWMVRQEHRPRAGSCNGSAHDASSASIPPAKWRRLSRANNRWSQRISARHKVPATRQHRQADSTAPSVEAHAWPTAHFPCSPAASSR